MARRRRPRYQSSWAGAPSYGWYPPSSRPRPADGIKARSRRGDIGATWWSRRFIEVLESFNMGARLARGRRYARAGQVLDLSVATGEATARVQGSRAAPYRARIRVLTLSTKDWAQAEEAMAARASFLAKLLAGEMPASIEEAFAACRHSLFPASARDLTTDCSCPDWANPCKHVAATYYLLAEAFDEDPFLIFRWRGREKEDLLEGLRARRSGGGGDATTAGAWEAPAVAVPPLDECLDAFWNAGSAVGEPRTPPRATETPAAILRELAPPEIDVAGRTLTDVLGPAYVAMTAAAERLALTGSREDEPSSATKRPRPRSKRTSRASGNTSAPI